MTIPCSYFPRLAQHCAQDPALGAGAFLHPAESLGQKADAKADPKADPKMDPKATGQGMTEDDQPAKLEDLLAFLQTSLTDHFIPTVIVRMHITCVSIYSLTLRLSINYVLGGGGGVKSPIHLHCVLHAKEKRGGVWGLNSM